MKYLIGNHKMNLNTETLTVYFSDLKKVAKNSDNQVGVCVPYVYLPFASKMLKGSKVWFGAQNMFYAEKGAYTGEVSAEMLKDFNTKLVIIGHSERRQIFKETDEMINKKVIKAISSDLTPILCVGETLEERQNKLTNKILKSQITKGLAGTELNNLSKMLFAYEPVWAIGTGVSATFKEAEDTIKYIKTIIAKFYNITETDNIIVLYGGSLNAKNVDELLASKFIDGGLIGGASLKVDDFDKLINYNKKTN